MIKLNVTVHDVYNSSKETRPHYGAILLAASPEVSTPLAFHSGLIMGEDLKQMRRLKDAGTVSVQVDADFFEEDLAQQRKSIIRSALLAAGLR